MVTQKGWIFWLAMVLGIVCPGFAFAAEFGGSGSKLESGYSQSFSFGTNRAIDDFTTQVPACGSMRVVWDQSSAAVVSMYKVKSSGGTLAAIEASTLVAQLTTDTTLQVDQTDAFGFRFVVDTAETSTTPSVVQVFCSTSLASGASRLDRDFDGLYDYAVLWDADGDGSGITTCTGNATPDIRCKAIGEKLWADFSDDMNCAIHGCGFGQMEYDGTIKLLDMVYVGFPCWSPTGTNTALGHETNDNLHDEAGGGDAAAYADCPVDGDGEALTVVSTQGWGGTVEGMGADTRNLHRGLMSASLRRDVGTYVVNDMGRWDSTNNDNVWFGNGDNQRFLSSGFHTNTQDANHPNGGGAFNGDSKGWWRVLSNVSFEAYVNPDQMICIQNTGGVVGTDYAASGTVTNLIPGDTILIPVKPTSTAPATTYNTYALTVRSVNAAACGGGANLGFWVNIGGTQTIRGTDSSVLPPSAAAITAADGVRIVHARTDYENTRVTWRNIRFDSQDPVNEVGGRCTNSGAAWRASLSVVGTLFSLTTDDTNTSNACDTGAMFGLWGGGWVRIEDSVVANFHKYALDAGGTGYADVENVKFLFGQGQEVADTSNGWRFKNVIIDQSSFIGGVFNGFAPNTQYRDILIRNSFFVSMLTLDHQSPKTEIDGLRIEGSQYLNAIRATCGAVHNTVRNVYAGGRNSSSPGGNSPTVIYLECDEAARPITQNLFENIILDAPDVAQLTDTAPVVQFYIITDNLADGTGDGTDETSTVGWGGIVGNVFRGVRSMTYVGGTAGEMACLYAVGEEGVDAPPDDDGESVVFTRNYFEGGSVGADGRVFCMATNGTPAVATTPIDSTGAATPAWGDPQGCGNMDGGTVYADENCL